MNLQKPLIASPPWTVEEEGQLRSQVVQGQTSVGDRGPTPANRKRNSTSHDKVGITVKARKIHAAGRAGAESEEEIVMAPTRTLLARTPA